MTATKNLIFLTLLAVFVFAMICLALNRPCPQIYGNFDEVGYNSLAVSLLKNGTYKLDAAPDGIVSTDSYFAANPLLYPYLSYVSFKLFGISRVAMRLPSALAYIGAGTVLLLMVRKLNLPRIQATGVLLTFLLCPFLIFSGCIARPEMVGTLAVYLSAFCCLKANDFAAGGRMTLLFASGIFSGLAVWNHALFACVATLPLLLVDEIGHFKNIKKITVTIITWALGVGAVICLLFLVIVAPHWAAWKEQFPLNSASVSAFNSSYHHIQQPTSVLELLMNLRARFSTFGYQYLAWYAAIPIFCFLILKPTPRFVLAFVLLVGWQLVIEWKTAIEVAYVVQLCVGIPMALMLCEVRKVKWFERDLSLALVSLIGAILVGLHAYWVLQPSPASRSFAEREQQLNGQIKELPGHGPIFGPVEAGLPSWQNGRRYFLPNSPFFMAAKDIGPHYEALVRQQADWVVAKDLQISPEVR